MMQRLLLIFMLALTVAAHGEGEDVSSATSKVQADIKQATLDLGRLRDEIAAERGPLVERHDALEADVRARRDKLSSLDAILRRGQQEQRDLSAAVSALEGECRFVHAALSEYRRSLETRYSAATVGGMAEDLGDIDRLLPEDNGFAHLTAAGEKLLNLASLANERALRGSVFDGETADRDGTVRAGRFAEMGPLVWFGSDDGALCGLVVNRAGSALPGVHPADDAASVQRLLTGARSTVPMDVSDGDALRIAEVRTSTVQHLKSGGFVMVPLLGVGLLSLALALWKILALATVSVPSVALARSTAAAAESGSRDLAREEAGKVRGPLKALLFDAVDHHAAQREHLEEILHECIQRCVPYLDRGIGILAVLAGVAPLLGLLGTVTGMIHTFQLVTVFGTGDAGLLSSGISEALITTEVGLAIAIPVLLIHAFLVRRVRSLVGRMDDAASAFVSELTERPDSRGRE